eukprot:858498-Rhodomonas_salina.2
MIRNPTLLIGISFLFINTTDFTAAWSAPTAILPRGTCKTILDVGARRRGSVPAGFAHCHRARLCCPILTRCMSLSALSLGMGLETSHKRRRTENVEGNFFVDESCKTRGQGRKRGGGRERGREEGERKESGRKEGKGQKG